MECFLDDYKVIELTLINHIGLKADCLSDIDKEGEVFKNIIFDRINGFSSEKRLTTYEEVKTAMESYGLDIKKLYLDQSIDRDSIAIYILSPIIYLYKGFTIDIIQQGDYHRLFRHLKKVCDTLDNYFLHKKPLPASTIYFSVQRQQINMFNLFAGAMEKEDRISFGRGLYFSSDYGANNIYHDLIKEMFENYNTVDSPYLTIYRGVGSKSTPLEKAYAWTKNIDVAKFFATRLSSQENTEDIKVYKMLISKEDIISIDDGIEEEVIINVERIEHYIDSNLIEEVDFDKSISYSIPARPSSENITKEKEDEPNSTIDISTNLTELLNN